MQNHIGGAASSRCRAAAGASLENSRLVRLRLEQPGLAWAKGYGFVPGVTGCEPPVDAGPGVAPALLLVAPKW